MEQIGIRIRNLRLAENLTQKELASKIGLTPKMISFYENSERFPPIDIIIKLVNIFGVTADYLLGLTSTPNPHVTNHGEQRNLTFMVLKIVLNKNIVRTCNLI